MQWFGEDSRGGGERSKEAAMDLTASKGDWQVIQVPSDVVAATPCHNRGQNLMKLRWTLDSADRYSRHQGQ
jgi:hypothetical protein